MWWTMLSNDSTRYIRRTSTGVGAGVGAVVDAVVDAGVDAVVDAVGADFDCFRTWNCF